MSCKCKDKVIIKYLDTYPHELKPALEGDAGIDIYASEDVVLAPFKTTLIPTGLYLELPKGYEIQVRPKSGLSIEGLDAKLGTVDEGYRGEVHVIASNMEYKNVLKGVYNIALQAITDMGLIAYEKFEANVRLDCFYKVEKGQKIAQIVPSKLIDFECVPVKELSEAERGTNGFGSTGV